MKHSTSSQTANSNPYDQANFFSKFTYWWLKDLMRIGLTKEIHEGDICRAAKGHKSTEITKVFTYEWEKEKQKEKKGRMPKLLNVMFSIFGWSVLSFGFVGTSIKCVSRILRPLFLGGLILYYTPDDNSDITLGTAYKHATGIVLCTLLPLLIFHPMQLFYFESSMKMKIGCTALIYDKILRLSSSTTMDGLNGKVINLVSNDVVTLDYATCFLQEVWVGPVEAIIMGYFIYKEIGFYGLIGIGVMIVFIPLQAWMGRMAAQIRLMTALRTDARIKFMNEIIQGIQVIKVYAWESVFASRMVDVRQKELNAIRQSAWIKATLLSFHVLPQISIFFSFVLYAYFNQDAITARKAFIVIAYFNALRASLVDFWPLAIASVAEGYVSIKRIEEFLLIEETRHCVTSHEDNTHCDIGVQLKSATAYWSRDEKSIGIKDFTATMCTHGLYIIVGQVGAGKTSLFQVILGELELDSGRIEVNGSVSYSSQLSWIFEGSVKSNIVFNEKFDAKKYKMVVDACALDTDMKQLPYGDETLVGEKGISLSGGQKTRINLARAIYKDADIYILDDPFSAVDVNVGKLIFSRCIKGYLKAKIIILITHQMQYLAEARNIIVMNKGRIKSEGMFELLKSDVELSSYLLTSMQYTSNAAPSSSMPAECEEVKDVDDVEKALPLVKREQVKETQFEGAVKINVYGEFMRAAKSWVIVGSVCFLFLATQIFMSGADYFVSIWTNWETQSNASGSGWTTNTFVYIYSGIIVLLIFFITTRSVGFYMMCIRISSNLHKSLYNGVVRAKMYFFNTNSSGRVLNRFSRDIGSIDSYLPVVLVDTLIFFFELLGVVVLVSTVNYWLIIPTVMMVIVFYLLRHSFLTTARNVKRVEAITRSPVYAKINETIQGLTTIKAFNGQSAAVEAFQECQDLNTSATFLFIATTRGFAFWLDVTSAIYLTAVTYAFLLLGTETLGGNVGLAITQAINLVGMCNWGLRQTSELENQMTSMERVLEYSKLEAEPPLKMKTCSPNADWPHLGKIEFHNVSLKYSSDYVLREIEFKVKPGEKVGIVGRTGAGKSSITQAIFRLTDYEGSIIVDGLDLKTLGLHDFRSRISIIPQDPILFSGTLRMNIDPFGRVSDADIWHTLEQVKMGTMVSQVGGDGLDTKISDGGMNFSIGQRQLICLARALVRNNKILVLDEATANVDAETDTLIQKTIRKHFIGTTILTIAHRVHTILDHDTVIVMDSGKIIEMDSVEHLLRRQGVFAQMVEESGIAVENNKKKM